ncbi:hypothetical protein GLAREA_05019 [Glarea lozoyensis ATCC 20868]|uniref:Uncharacterized protein n=2 Tax=Glarea lozoyensis TaxID=101852 RepID=S3DB29_GLAL2|nr:uncharacterized protein GLAREA_05019 [Glarea lozoyensis ATCC 20868]EHK99648.1 hypothetical protein M7I_4525 [Glarea lozoyensis 74030]EPE35682.1 hypothetical protein GLAREA_05019 [Glarea lozoyensis ATCC 20868]
MDLFKKAKAAAGGSSSSSQQQPAGQKQDYGDKIIAAGTKKAGYNTTGEQNEKIGDTARGLYEKFTGKKVNPKFSN